MRERRIPEGLKVTTRLASSVSSLPVCGFRPRRDFLSLILNLPNPLSSKSSPIIKEDFDNDRKDAGELGAGHTVTALYEIVTTGRHTDYVRKLKYQPTQVIPEVPQSGELATIKFRYKKPDGDKSILITEVIPQWVEPASETSNNFRFSAAVAGFGMLLRNSEFKGTINYDQVLTLARGSKGDDRDGYRAEFIRLVELSDSNGLTSDNEN